MVLGMLFFTSCEKDDEPQKGIEGTRFLSLKINGLEDLGTNYRYEGWMIVNGAPISTGVFSVNSSGEMSQTSFSLNAVQLFSATKFVLTIEPFPDSDPAPSHTHILAGDFSNDKATLTIGAPEALGNNFTNATGKYVLATPSNGSNTDEKSGVWFLGSLPPTAGLQLPVLPQGWKYEGWAVVNGKAITTGTFTNAAAADMFNGFSGNMGTPPFPGEDFLVNAPAMHTFPLDLSGGKVVISIEPDPDNSPAPFLLKPLVGDVPQNAQDHVVYDMVNHISGTLSGSATR